MVGTGPYMLTEWVKGSSLTYSKNPDYWDFDEKYPDNRLPYIDQINRLIMPDKATSRAALRSGKVDYIGQPGINQFQAAEVASFQRTNPEIVFSPWAFRSETSVAFNVRHPSPFQDIRVRKAMQMTIDLETINNTYFGGFGMTTSQGIIGDGLQGYFVPFEEWPEATRNVFTYDPEGAEALLDEAGYPRGADGVRFKVVHNPLPTWDLGYQEITVEYWDAIGIDVEIRTHEGTQLTGLITDGTYEGMTFMDLGNDTAPNLLLNRLRIGQVWGRTGHQDAVMHSKVEAAMAAPTLEEQQRCCARTWSGPSPKAWSRRRATWTAARRRQDTWLCSTARRTEPGRTRYSAARRREAACRSRSGECSCSNCAGIVPATGRGPRSWRGSPCQFICDRLP